MGRDGFAPPKPEGGSFTVNSRCLLEYLPLSMGKVGIEPTMLCSGGF